MNRSLTADVTMAVSSPLLTRRTALAVLAAPLAGPALAQTAAPAIRQRIELALAPLIRPVREGAPDAPLIGVNGTMPGPVLRVRRGTPVDLVIRNGLDEPTALRIHGLRTTNAGDGTPGLTTTPILPGETRVLPVETPDAGTYLYGPVLAGRTSTQRERGLGGLFIVEEPNPPAVDLDHSAALDDIRLDLDGRFGAEFPTLDAVRSGRLGSLLLVNGRPGTENLTVRPNARIRLRLGSLANARIMPMKFENLKATVIALDGQACDPFDPLKRTVVMLPGSRYDVMLDAPAEAKAEGRVVVALGQGITVVRIVTEGEPLPVRPPVQPLPMNDLPPSIRLQNAARNELTISGALDRPLPGAPTPSPADLARLFPPGQPVFRLNDGAANGFAGKPVFSVRRGAPVVLKLVNRTAWPQVLTVHGHVFRLLHPLDDGWEPYFMDTLHMPDNSIARIAFDASNPGKWAIRSTIAEHYDAGVATWFEVTG